MNWLKTKINQFLCEHKRTQCIKRIITKQYLLNDKKEGELFRTQHWFKCLKCGRISTLKYKAKI